MSKRSYSDSSSSRRIKRKGRYPALSSYGPNRSTRSFSRNVTNSWPYSTYNSYKYAWDPFPAIVRVRMRYSTSCVLAATAGVPASNLYRCNSIFDPDYTGVGHQPYGHDIYAQIYNHYRVIKATITITQTTGFNGVIGCAITDDTTVEQDYDTIKERKGTKVIGSVSGSSVGGQIVHYWKPGLTGDPISKNIASFGAGPPDPMYFHVFATGSASGQADTAHLMVNIVYDCELSELQDLGQS